MFEERRKSFHHFLLKILPLFLSVEQPIQLTTEILARFDRVWYLIKVIHAACQSWAVVQPTPHEAPPHHTPDGTSDTRISTRRDRTFWDRDYRYTMADQCQSNFFPLPPLQDHYKVLLPGISKGLFLLKSSLFTIWKKQFQPLSSFWLVRQVHSHIFCDPIFSSDRSLSLLLLCGFTFQRTATTWHYP